MVAHNKSDYKYAPFLHLFSAHALGAAAILQTVFLHKYI